VAIKTEVLDKGKAADAVLKEIDKRFGDNTIQKLGDRVNKKMPSIPTGMFSVDNEVLGIGGFPKGRVVELFGTESGGKTTLALTVIATAQRAGGRAAFIDAENSFDPVWAKKNGVDVDALAVSQPDSGEDALEIVEMLVDSEGYDIIVVDSVAALVPRAELEGEMGDSHVGLQARLMSQALRKLTGKVNRTGTCLIFINQIREKIGVMFGSPETTSGGRALKFYSSVRLDIRRIGQVKDGDTVVGSKVRIKCVKNKTSAPFRESEVNLLYDRGFDAAGNTFDTAVALGIVDRNGSWFSYKGDRLGQGRDAVVDAIVGGHIYDSIYKELVSRSNGEAMVESR
jgi:recombination protein RecA